MTMHWTDSFIIAVILSIDLTLTSDVIEESTKSSHISSPISSSNIGGKHKYGKYVNRRFVCASF